MTQINPIYTEGVNLGKPFVGNGHNIRRLFVETGFGYIEIASSAGGYEGEALNKNLKHYGKSSDNIPKPIGRIVEDYVPPSPSMKFVEVKIANAPSHIHSSGKGSYKVSLRILYPDKFLLTNFLLYAGNTFKFYDERGAVYLGAMDGEPDIRRAEGGQIYDVKINLRMVRKDHDDTLEEIKYTDLDANFDKFLMETDYNATSGGVISYNFDDGTNSTSGQYIFGSGYSIYSIAEALNRWYVLGKYFKVTAENTTIIFSPKKVDYGMHGTPSIPLTIDVTLNNNSQIFNTNITKVSGEHWAKEYIEEAARAGIITTLDKYGNPVYVFRPEDQCRRSEAISILNRLRKYLERMVRA